MPAKCGEHHTHVDPGSCDATDVLFALVNNSEDGRGRFVEVVEIKIAGKVVEVLVLGFAVLRDGEAAAMFFDLEVCRIFDTSFEFPLGSICIITYLP